MLHKYLDIIDRKTGYILALCLVLTYLCLRLDFSYSLNITMISIAVVFPLVFTIRQAFRKRDMVIRLLSTFKASLNASYYCFANNRKLSAESKRRVAEDLNSVSRLFFTALKSREYDLEQVRGKLSDVYEFINANRDCIPAGVALKIIRFLRDVNASMENTVGLKLHGTPVSLRAYCLVFIYLFPVIFIPSLVGQMAFSPPWVIYALAVIHGFILISLYNVQDHMEDPFDQIGLDDVRLEEFHFRKQAPAALPGG